MPTPTARISAADSKMRQGIPAACSASPSVNPPMPAPTMMISSMFPSGALLRGVYRDETRLVSLLSISEMRSPQRFLVFPHKAHPHPRGVAGGLTGEPFGAGPGPEAAVVVGGVRALQITMCAPAVLIFGAGQLRT